jgi:hypothetical protein
MSSFCGLSLHEGPQGEAGGFEKLPARKSNIFLWSLAFGVCLFALLFIHALYANRKSAPFVNERIALVERYGLTDLCLFTDARYTRNPAVADTASPFQDHPVSLEHFPSGSIVNPRAWKKYGLD